MSSVQIKLRNVVLCGLVALLLSPFAGGVSALAQQPPKKGEPIEEFVPIDELPSEDQLPAAPLVIGAYSFVWLAFFLYLVSGARRMSTVQKEVERLETDIRSKPR